MKAKLEYKVLATIYFIVTFILIGFAIVSLVQGFVSQVAGGTIVALLYYVVTPFLVMGSYLTFNKGYYKLRVIAMSRT